MKFQTHNDDPKLDTFATCMQGYIQATKAQMIKTFGQPYVSDVAERVIYHWTLRFADGTIATVYDWMSGRYLMDDEVYAWHIGGHSGVAVSRVHEAFRAAHGLLAKNA